MKQQREEEEEQALSFRSKGLARGAPVVASCASIGPRGAPVVASRAPRRMSRRTSQDRHRCRRSAVEEMLKTALQGQVNVPWPDLHIFADIRSRMLRRMAFAS
ncbi:unnamed protein product [Symbiodinium sp. CCMP2592]|nr:unnamed protein product [Symbiodinium sp. CCMP2592]